MPQSRHAPMSAEAMGWNSHVVSYDPIFPIEQLISRFKHLIQV